MMAAPALLRQCFMVDQRALGVRLVRVVGAVDHFQDLDGTKRGAHAAKDRDLVGSSCGTRPMMPVALPGHGGEPGGEPGLARFLLTGDVDNAQRRRPRRLRSEDSELTWRFRVAEGGLMMSGGGAWPDGVALTNLDQPLFDGADATKRDLVDYLEAVADHIIPELADRPLSVVRVLRGQAPFMQKNVPSYTPSWVRRVSLWAETSKRDVSYALCNDRRTLLWFANQRAVEYHPTLIRAEHWDRPTHLVLDLDPPSGDTFGVAVRAAHLVRQALADAGLAGVVKTSGAKGVHVFVPIDAQATAEEMAAATRAIAARAERLDPELATTAYIRDERGGKVFVDSTRAYGATVVAAYSPRVRPGAPVSFPVAWDQLECVTPADFSLRTAARSIAGQSPWADAMPPPQHLGADLIEEGRAIPVARVQAMHEGKRRARARRG
jgi:bifunctional non-homologous end joining protein LigD